MAKVRVAIGGTEFIPCLGKGPFSDIWITEELYRILQRLGYVVTKLDQDSRLDLNVPVQPVSAPAEVLETAPVAEPTVEAQPEPVAPVAEVTEQPTPVAAEVTEQPAPVAEPVAETPAPVAEQPVVEEIPAAEVAEEESSEEAQPVEVTLTAEEEEALKTTATKKEIQEILTAHGVKYKYNDTIEQLLAYVGLTR